MKETICWDCKRATGYCAWSKSFKAVKGWKAVPTKIQRVTPPYDTIDSYLVLECPLFEPDARRHVSHSELATMLGIGYVKDYSNEFIVARGKQMGLKITVGHTDISRHFYVEKLKEEDKRL